MSQVTEKVWEGLPTPMKNGVKRAWAGYARVTNGARLLPDYLIIGTQRSGTTSLYKYLVKHPGIAHALTKELRFFDLNYDRGAGWYRSRFPSKRYKEQVRRRTGVDLVVGEGSPDYMFHPHAPARAAGLLPDAKLIVLLRNPVDRAWSHYWHQVSRGFEDLPFEEAIRREPERLAGELERILADEHYVSFERHHHSYLTRGVYVDQLQAWMRFYPRDRFFIERSEAFFEDPRSVLRAVQAFLGVPPLELPRYESSNAFSEGSMSPALRDELVGFFRPHNERLYEFLGRDFEWDR